MDLVKRSLWRVPLIALVSGFFWTPCMVRLLLRFAVTAPGVIDDAASLVLHGLLTAAVVIAGGGVLLRKLPRREIFLSASLVVAYHLLLSLVQRLGGWTTGPAAVLFMKLYQPLEWTGFPFELLWTLLPQDDPSAAYLVLLSLPNYLMPYLFLLFGHGPVFRKTGGDRS